MWHGPTRAMWPRGRVRPLARTRTRTARPGAGPIRLRLPPQARRETVLCARARARGQATLRDEARAEAGEDADAQPSASRKLGARPAQPSFLVNSQARAPLRAALRVATPGVRAAGHARAAAPRRRGVPCAAGLGAAGLLLP
jgi:hypothetical protein